MKHLVKSILSSSTSPENWESSINEFNNFFNVSASSLFGVNEFGKNSVNFVVSDFHKQRFPKGFLEGLERGEDAADKIGYQFLFNSSPQKFYTEPAMFGVKSREELPPSPVREMIESQGLTTRIATALNQTGPWLDVFAVQCKTDAEWQTILRNPHIDIILPIMGNSLALGRVLQALRSRYKFALSMLNALGLAVFLVDASGSVIEHNKEAHRILDAKDGLLMTGSKRLKLHSSDKTSELDAMINTANGLLQGELKAGNTLMVSERPSGDYDYLISVQSLSDSNAELETGLKCAFVTIIDPARKNALSSEGITVLGQLSKAESEVVNLLVQGVRPSDVAEQRDVSLNTVKTQLKGISQKLRCSTQSDIIRMAAATKIPIENASITRLDDAKIKTKGDKR